MATLAQLDYPELEIIGVDDRSEDATGRILDEFAASHPRFRAIHVKELPAGWLGKPHALQQAYEASSGEWLLFTDADVRFKVDVLATRDDDGHRAQAGSPIVIWRCGNGGLLGKGGGDVFWNGVSYGDGA